MSEGKGKENAQREGRTTKMGGWGSVRAMLVTEFAKVHAIPLPDAAAARFPVYALEI